jgi:hypothetical protein
MSGFIQSDPASSWQPDLRDGTPARFHHFPALDVLGAQGDLLVQARWLFVGSRGARTRDALPDIRWQRSRLSRGQVNANASQTVRAASSSVS